MNHEPLKPKPEVTTGGGPPKPPSQGPNGCAPSCGHSLCCRGTAGSSMEPCHVKRVGETSAGMLS